MIQNNTVESQTLKDIIGINYCIALFNHNSDLYNDAKFISFVVKGWI